MTRLLMVTASSLVLAGCAAGPNYVSPAPQAPAQAEFTSAADPAFVPDEPPKEWWKLFDAPVLDRLIDEALEANTDLRVAAANLERARAALSEVRSARLPSTEISANGQYARQAGATTGVDGALYEGEIYDGGLGVSYQVDLFGRIRRGIEASRADLGVAQASYDLARISVVAETARAYAQACSAGRQLSVAQESLRVQEETFDLTRRLEEGGRGTGLDTSRANALLEQTRAALPSFAADRRAALFSLAVLTGRTPSEFPSDVASCEEPPVIASALPVGDGASLLARRPDVRAAERRLAAATARVGVATADLYPNVTLGGSIGTTATSIDDLGSDGSFRFSLGPLISWSFPNITASRARLRQAQATSKGALAAFDGAWFNALRESETALTRYAAQRERVESLSRSRDQNAEAARIARLRYQYGAESFQIVLDAERSLADSEAVLAVSRANLANQSISLFLALGGGWRE
ncbi:efflux transporter outer membrane subunit [Altericroceibacterium endophyticum]|uniref:Efflux transporter outer membrane subunit n=1 Tax=Altericroceibacterium endophyticum TaxID=1808508 RepID=A0A6I4T3D6_9SPHN|nr:TolC family protein [Altericroceibacterium endophyticum]MXO64500.1 efflux transporter outer membrane subunit [Altericroceibacterium endophyticum]